jgi:hypothetical protein
MRCQNRVTELLFQHMNGRLKMKGHPEFVRDQFGLIDLAAAVPAHIQFLKSDDVRFARRDHTNDTARRQLTVKPKAPVNVIGQNAGQVC